MHSELREAGKDILSIAALTVRMKRIRASLSPGLCPLCQPRDYKHILVKTA